MNELSINDAGYLMSILAKYADWDEIREKYLISFDNLLLLFNEVLKQKEN